MSDLVFGNYSAALTSYDLMLEAARSKVPPPTRLLRGRFVRDDGYFYGAEGWEHPHVSRRFAGMAIEIENPAGSVRSGTDREGKRWSVRMANDYGFVRGTRAIDGDAVDVFLGPNEQAGEVYVIHQNDPISGTYDEDKVMLGFDSAESAKSAYLANYDSPKFFRSMTTMGLEQFRAAMKSNATGTIRRKRKLGDPSIGPMFSAGDWPVSPAEAIAQQKALLLKSEADLLAARDNAVTSSAAEDVSTPMVPQAQATETVQSAAADIVPVEGDPTDPDKTDFAADPLTVRLANPALADAEKPRVQLCPKCETDISDNAGCCEKCGWKPDV